MHGANHALLNDLDAHRARSVEKPFQPQKAQKLVMASADFEVLCFLWPN
jgi:hypothetical protein